MRKVAFLSSLLILLSACQPGGSSGSGAGPIKIGYIGPLTGDAASYGADTLHGVQLAVEAVNAANGVNGRKVELIAEDGRCTGSESASAAQKLVNVDKVVAIIGGQCSGETLAAAPIAEAAKIVLISPVSSSPDVTKAGDFVFRDYPSDALKTKAMAKYFSERGYKKIAMISENTDFAMAFRASLKIDAEVDTVVFDEVVEPGTKDFRTLMTRLKKVDFDLFFPNAQSDAVMAPMVQQLREQGLNQQILTHDVGDSVTLLELVPEAIAGAHVINVPTSGAGGTFEQRFREQFGDAQSTIAFAAHAFDAVGVVLQAIATVGTDGERIRDYLYALDAYEGIVGKISFDANGDVIGIPYGLKEFKDGTIVQVADIAVD